MMIILELLAKTVRIFLDVVMGAMFLRMLYPLFFDTEESVVYTFLCMITEPVVVPVRFLFYLFGIGQDSPVDWSFSAAYLILATVELFLPVL